MTKASSARMDLLQGEVARTDGNAVSRAQRDDIGARHAVEAELAGSRCRTAPSRTKKKLVALQLDTKPLRIEHQRLVGARLDRLDQRLDEIEPAVRIEPHVEHVGRRAADRRGEKAEPLRDDRLARFLVFGDDDDGGLAGALRGSWLTARFSPRVTIRRIWTPVSILLAARRRLSSAVSSSRASPISSAMARAPS